MKWKKNKKQKDKKRLFFKKKKDQVSSTEIEETTSENLEKSTQASDEMVEDVSSAEIPATETGSSYEIDENDEYESNEADENDASPQKQKKRVFKRLKERLKKSRNKMGNRFKSWGKKRLDDELMESLEEALITADVGVETTMSIMDNLSEKIRKKMITTAEELQTAVLDALLQLLPEAHFSDDHFPYRPHVILVVGVNGVGKTTTIGKLASRLIAQGKKVIIGASDTFRAAAVEQLELWAERSQADIVRHKENADPAAVAFDTVQAAISRKADVAIIDTAGRLHTKKNLMEEIRKIRRSISKKLPEAPHDIFLVLDATTGQNAVSQTRLFHEALNVTGLILTKLDGTAKGGIVVSITNAFDIPIRYIGIGEQIEDLQTFDSEMFVRALIES